MIISKCSVCGEATTGEDQGRQALVTVEKYSDSGMSVNRFYVCSVHEQKIMELLNPVEDGLAKTAGVCGND